MFDMKRKQFIFYTSLTIMFLSAVIIYIFFLKAITDNFAYKSAFNEAKRSAEQLLVTRSVISEIAPHVKVIDDKVSEFAFTPAAVGISISNKMKDETDYYIKQTSLIIRNQNNAPDKFEEYMLKKLDSKNLDEYSQRAPLNGVDTLRYGKALYVEESCMRCHGIPYKDVPKDIYETLVNSYGDVAFNYKVGDLRGMISIAIPMEEFTQEYNNIFKTAFISSLVLMLLLLMIFYLNNRFIIQPHIKLLDDTNNELENIAFLDLLTNIPNRRAFNNKLHRFIDNETEFWLLLIDLDGFKGVNDTLGHDAGDIVLKVFTQRVEAINENIKLFRLGGDEFTAIVFDHNEKNQIKELADTIIKQSNMPINVGTENAKIGASIGAVHFPNDATEFDSLIAYGDMAMYSAKHNGKNNTVFFTTELLESINSVKQLEIELKEALVQNQFFLLYQPQYDYATEQIIGVEALLRWNHPTKGVISPDDFIAVAEDTGLIKEIGKWIMFEATKQNKSWQDIGYKQIIISINVTSVQLNDFGFLMNLIDVINETRLDPEYLEIEFIERDAISNEGQAVEFMEQLKRFKISSAIDDFGTGYSSLSYITKYPIKKIKIDKLFITDIHEDTGHQAIVKSIISIAKTLDIKIIAEGVEKEEELEFLMNEGCSAVQGYLYSKPLTSEEMGIVLKRESQKEIDV